MNVRKVCLKAMPQALPPLSLILLGFFRRCEGHQVILGSRRPLGNLEVLGVHVQCVQLTRVANCPQLRWNLTLRTLLHLVQDRTQVSGSLVPGTAQAMTATVTTTSPSTSSVSTQLKYVAMVPRGNK